MSNIDKQALREVAEKATPGPWYVHDKPCEDGNYGIDTSDKEFLAEAVVWWGFSRQSIWREEDAKHIAAANPATVLALLDELEAAEKRTAEMEQQLIKPLPIGELLQRLENQTGEPWGERYLAFSELQQEPVAWIAVYHGEVYDDATGPTRSVVEAHANKYGWESALTEVKPLYTIPPAPVVPDEISPKQASRSYGGEVHGYRDGWNACRAAMLQGKAEHVSNRDELNSPVIPDWHVEAERIAEVHGASFVIFRHSEKPVCADPSKFWFGYDPAAPQQEQSNG